MGDTQRPGSELVSTSNLPPGGAQPGRASELKHELSPEIQLWLTELNKLLRASRVYADNNETLQRQLDRAFLGLTRVLEKQPELTLAVREDRLLFEKDPVHVNADREEGIPFVFYRNAFRRLTFVAGMGRDELLSLVRAISTDYSSGLDYAGEDLVTTLWRMALPHLRYLTIDALTSDSTKRLDRDEGDQQRGEVERIQADIDTIVASIYRSNTSDEDLVAGVSITREDLEALKGIRLEDPEELDLLDHATARAIADIPESELESVRAALDGSGNDPLVHRTVEILIELVFKERSGQDAAFTLELLQQLFDSLVLARRFAQATTLSERLRATAEGRENLQSMHVARHVLRLLASEARVLPVLSALNDGSIGASFSEVSQFLRALGPNTAPIILKALDDITSPTHRRLLADLIIEFGVPELSLLMQKAESAKWFVVRDLLYLAQQLPVEQIAPMVAFGLAHAHPRVREYAVGMLRGYGRGLADRFLSERILDEDVEVRLAAVRVAAARRSSEARSALEQLLENDGFGSREHREQRLMMAAYAAIAGAEAVPLLDRLLNPGLLSLLKGTDTQVSAAFALASIGPEAAPVLQRGLRSLSGKVRDACRRALSREAPSGVGSGREEEAREGNPSILLVNAARPETSERPDGDEAGQAKAESRDEARGEYEFNVSGGTVEPREAADLGPPFDPSAEVKREAAPKLSPILRERPSMARVERPYAVPDELGGPPSSAGSGPPRQEPAQPSLVPESVPAAVPTDTSLRPDYRRAIGVEIVPAVALRPPTSLLEMPAVEVSRTETSEAPEEAFSLEFDEGEVSGGMSLELSEPPSIGSSPSFAEANEVVILEPEEALPWDFVPTELGSSDGLGSVPSDDSQPSVQSVPSSVGERPGSHTALVEDLFLEQPEPQAIGSRFRDDEESSR